MLGTQSWISGGGGMEKKVFMNGYFIECNG